MSLITANLYVLTIRILMMRRKKKNKLMKIMKLNRSHNFDFSFVELRRTNFQHL